MNILAAGQCNVIRVSDAIGGLIAYCHRLKEPSAQPELALSLQISSKSLTGHTGLGDTRNYWRSRMSRLQSWRFTLGEVLGD